MKGGSYVVLFVRYDMYLYHIPYINTLFLSSGCPVCYY